MLNVRPAPHEYVTSLEGYEWMAGARTALARLHRGGYPLVVASNQRGVARGLVDSKVLEQIERKVQDDLRADGVEIAAFFYCPHDTAEQCDCRKPAPGMLLRAAEELGLDLGGSTMIGDSETDVQAGRAAGCRTIRIGPAEDQSAADALVADLPAAAELVLGVPTYSRGMSVAGKGGGAARLRSGARLVLGRGRRLVKRRRKDLKRARRLGRNVSRAARRRALRARTAALRGARPLYRLSYTRSLARIPTRNELPHVLNRRGLVGRGVEVGVLHGAFSEFLLREWRGRELISVDPWLEQAPEVYLDRANKPQETQDEIYAATRRRLSVHGERSRIWRSTSVEAAREVAAASLDFVYVDARHDYDSVREDLEAWYEKIRPGGLMAGHDYLDADRKGDVYGVRSAVDEFFGARGIAVHEIADRPWPSWIVELPAEDREASGHRRARGGP